QRERWTLWAARHARACGAHRRPRRDRQRAALRLCRHTGRPRPHRVQDRLTTPVARLQKNPVGTLHRSVCCGQSGSATLAYRRPRVEGESMSTAELIGASPQLAAILDDVRAVATTNCAVLIQGETGTGKELVARAIHEASARRQHRYIAINCAALPGALIESELFGYERGAFTGAVVPKMGRFQAADRGTLFL